MSKKEDVIKNNIKRYLKNIIILLFEEDDDKYIVDYYLTFLLILINLSIYYELKNKFIKDIHCNNIVVSRKIIKSSMEKK